MTPMNTDADTDRHCTDLTQLSSREQLSALMDGALPEDQTRFLLRRLRHDAELAGSWERWRIASDVMRGMAPSRRLPSDFAARVSAALHGAPVAETPAVAPPRSSWLRRGAGMGAIAAALAVVALMGQPSLEPDGGTTGASTQVAGGVPMPVRSRPVPQAPVVPAHAPDMLAAATMAAAATAKPARRGKPAGAPASSPASVPDAAVARVAAVQPTVGEAIPAEFPAVPQADIVTRPWPRSILPQYAGSGGLAVGFGEHPRRADNPFVPPVFSEPPKLLSDGAAAQESTAADEQGQQSQP